MKKEIELKYRFLNQHDFFVFLDFILPLSVGKKKLLHQTNYFFDTASQHLKKNGLSLRLRKQNNDYFLCVKQSSEQKACNNFLSIRSEYETLINKSIALMIIDGSLSPLEIIYQTNEPNHISSSTKESILHNISKLSHYGIYMIGHFKNIRTVIDISLGADSFTFEFDQTSYTNRLELFEVEVEFDSESKAVAAKPIIEGLLRQAHIKTSKARSKSSELYRVLFGPKS